jgi:hypothetical protein
LLQRLETRRLSFPAWVLAYRYRERLYRVVISGQDAAVIQGQTPISYGRIAGVVLLGLLACLVLVLVVA